MADTIKEWCDLRMARLPEPVRSDTSADGAIIFTGGDPGELVVRLTPSAVCVSEFRVEWEHPHSPVAHPRRVGSVAARHIAKPFVLAAIGALIDAARDSRRSKFRECGYCKQLKAPEEMHGDSVCQSCAKRHLGTVY